MKKLIYFAILSFFLLGLSFFDLDKVFAQEKIEINFFYSITCPHCAKEKIFLENLKQKYPEIELKSYEFSAKETQTVIEQFYGQYNVEVNQKGLVPITFIKEKYFLGFSEEPTGKEIEDYVKSILQKTEDPNTQNHSDAQTSSNKIQLPIIKEITPDQYSLAFLAVIMGFFDGFNVCSLGALILILGIVLAFRSRTKTLLFGLTFIVTTAVIYGLLIFIWHKIFLLFAPYITKMEFIIGLLALGAAGYFLWQFFKIKKQGAVCQSQGVMQKLSQKLNDTISNTSNLIMIALAILLFAAVVTIIEFPCSAVLPVLFASIISEANLSTSTSAFYIIIFLFFYMLDEIIVFLIAFFTLRIWVASPKFNIWLNFVAFIILFILAAYYLLI